MIHIALNYFSTEAARKEFFFNLKSNDPIVVTIDHDAF